MIGPFMAISTIFFGRSMGPLVIYGYYSLMGPHGLSESHDTFARGLLRGQYLFSATLCGALSHSNELKDFEILDYIQGCPWVHLWQIWGFFCSLKQAQEHPKQPRNEGDMVSSLFWPDLLHFCAILGVLGLVLKSRKSLISITGALMNNPDYITD